MSRRKPDTLFMETTEISPQRTIAEIQELLVSAGAKQILMEYAPDREVASVCFIFPYKGTDIPFRLPCRWQAIQEILAERNRDYRYWVEQEKKGHHDQYVKNIAILAKRYEAQARRVAWRTVLRWIEAQLAFSNSRMVTVAEAFFSYAQTPNGDTVFERMDRSGFAAFQIEHKP